MRSSLLAAFWFAIFAGGGCSRSGDVGTFLVTEVTRYGGHTITNGAFPKLAAHWTVKEDSSGFTARVSGVPFATVDSFMRQAFGPPKVSADTNLSSPSHSVWAAVDIGVAIQCIGRPAGVELICVKGGSTPRGGGR
jgi:hypothetical protein